MSEKTDIEWASGEAFISLYNVELATTYLAQPSEAPDIHCVDQKGNRLNLEITMTEDRPGDIKALLGRSEDRSLGTLKIHLAKVKEGKADPFGGNRDILCSRNWAVRGRGNVFRRWFDQSRPNACYRHTSFSLDRQFLFGFIAMGIDAVFAKDWQNVFR